MITKAWTTQKSGSEEAQSLQASLEAISVAVKKYSKIPAESEFVFAIGKIRSGSRPSEKSEFRAPGDQWSVRPYTCARAVLEPSGRAVQTKIEVFRPAQVIYIPSWVI